MSWDPAAALEAERQRTRERLEDLAGDYAGIVEASALESREASTMPA